MIFSYEERASQYMFLLQIWKYLYLRQKQFATMISLLFWSVCVYGDDDSRWERMIIHMWSFVVHWIGSYNWQKNKRVSLWRFSLRSMNWIRDYQLLIGAFLHCRSMLLFLLIVIFRLVFFCYRLLIKEMNYSLHLLQVVK